MLFEIILTNGLKIFSCSPGCIFCNEKLTTPVLKNVLKSFYLWDPRKLGDLTIRTAVAAVNGKDLQPGAELSGFGPLTFSSKDPTMIILSDPIRFTKDNISEYDWGF